MDCGGSNFVFFSSRFSSMRAAWIVAILAVAVLCFGFYEASRVQRENDLIQQVLELQSSPRKCRPKEEATASKPVPMGNDDDENDEEVVELETESTTLSSTREPTRRRTTTRGVLKQVLRTSAPALRRPVTEETSHVTPCVRDFFSKVDTARSKSNLIPGISKIYVPHWRKAYERRERMEAQFDRDLPGWREANYVRFLTEFGSEQLLNDTQLMTCVRGSPWPDPNISHLKQFSLMVKHTFAYFDMVRHGYGAALILEDDVLFQGHWTKMLRETVAALPKGWGIMSFSQTFHQCHHQGSQQNSQHFCPHSRAPISATSGTTAYIFSQRAARLVSADLPVAKSFQSDLRLDDFSTAHSAEFKAYLSTRMNYWMKHDPGGVGGSILGDLKKGPQTPLRAT